MNKKIVTWITVLVMAFTIVLGGSVSVFGAENDGQLYWSWKAPITESDAKQGVSAPAQRGNLVYVAAGDKFYQIIGEGNGTQGTVQTVLDMGGNIKYNRFAPTIGGSYGIVPLNDSKVAVFSLGTKSMELLKTVKYAPTESGYQSITPAVYDADGKTVYLGSWGGPNAGSYVQIDLDDGYAVKTIVKGKGFYNAGAAVGDKYVVFGSEASDDTTGNATLYAWDKTNPESDPISVEISGSGSIRSSVVEYNGVYYFTTKGGKLYQAKIVTDNESARPQIKVNEITTLGAASICTPLIVQDADKDTVTLYAGYRTVADDPMSAGGVKAVDLEAINNANNTNEATAITTYSNVPGDVTSLYKVASGTKSKNKIMATYNHAPGGIWDVKGDVNYFTPDSNMQSTCISSIVGTSTNKYYSNDSGYVMAVRDGDGATKYQVTIEAGKGGTVSPSATQVKAGADPVIKIVPDTGYKIESIKRNGVAQDLSSIELGNINLEETSYTIMDINEPTTISVLFARVGNPTTAKVEASVQTENIYDMKPKELSVRSDMAEQYGYRDSIVDDKISVLDVLVAAHIEKYGEEKSVINQKLVMASGGPTTMMGKTKKDITSTSNALTGFVVNDGIAWERKKLAATPGTAVVSSGDKVDFFWYVTDMGTDLWMAFFDNQDRMIHNKTIAEGESFDVTLKGMYLSSAMDTGKEKYVLTISDAYTGEFSLGDADLVVMEEEESCYVQKGKLIDGNGSEIKTDTATGTATLKLSPGKYFITASREGNSVDALFPGYEQYYRALMPWMEVTVTCDPHDFKDGVCKDCGELQPAEDVQIIKTDLKTVPAELSNKFSSIEELKTELLSRVIAALGYSAENTEFYDVKLQFKYDGKWIDATEANFPKEGITVEFPYPDGTARETHDFAISHMFTVTSDRLGTVAGETEQPEVTETETGLKATFNGLSPVSISWTETADDDDASTGDGNDGQVNDESDNEPKEKEDEATDTGDDFNALLFGIIALTAFAAAAATVFYRRKTN